MRLLLFLDSRYKLAGMTYEKQVVDMILPDFVPEAPPVPQASLCPSHTRRFLSGIQKKQWIQKAWIPDDKRRE